MLLTLPIEIRSQILSYLLTNSTPLSRVNKVTPEKRSSSTWIFSQRNDIVSWHFTPKKSLGIHPSILLVNKQLYTEGLPHLHANKVAIYIAQSFAPSPELVDVLGREWVSGLWRFRQLEFRIYVDFTRGSSKKSALEVFCERLRKECEEAGTELGDVKVEAWDGSFKLRYWEDTPEWKRELGCLAGLRCKSAVVGEGVPPECRKWLETVMVGGDEKVNEEEGEAEATGPESKL